MCKNTTNVEYEMYDHTGNNWRRWNDNERLEEKFGGHTKEIFHIITTKTSCTWSITYNTESAVAWKWKTDR